ncbi:MAG TPA: group 1 truncated hemoglobin [Galbitalea sp.]|jgi:hemoglobin|nr:group 1 truncated hemoglobin [Galbitalea sp.]
MVDNNMPADADAVSRGVTLFVGRMTGDPKLAWAFEGFDQAGLQRHAFAFVVAALGGPDLYLGRGMREVHASLKLRNEHFDTAVDHLLESLREVGISDGVTSDLAARLEPLRRQIVTA